MVDEVLESEFDWQKLSEEAVQGLIWLVDNKDYKQLARFRDAETISKWYYKAYLHEATKKSANEKAAEYKKISDQYLYVSCDYENYLLTGNIPENVPRKMAWLMANTLYAQGKYNASKDYMWHAGGYQQVLDGNDVPPGVHSKCARFFYRKGVKGDPALGIIQDHEINNKYLIASVYLSYYSNTGDVSKKANKVSAGILAKKLFASGVPYFIKTGNDFLVVAAGLDGFMKRGAVPEDYSAYAAADLLKRLRSNQISLPFSEEKLTAYVCELIDLNTYLKTGKISSSIEHSLAYEAHRYFRNMKKVFAKHGKSPFIQVKDNNDMTHTLDLDTLKHDTIYYAARGDEYRLADAGKHPENKTVSDVLKSISSYTAFYMFKVLRKVDEWKMARKYLERGAALDDILKNFKTPRDINVIALLNLIRMMESGDKEMGVQKSTSGFLDNLKRIFYKHPQVVRAADDTYIGKVRIEYGGIKKALKKASFSPAKEMLEDQCAQHEKSLEGAELIAGITKILNNYRSVKSK